MIHKSKHKGLLAPKFIDISKEEFKKVHLVRNQHNQLMGPHSLISWNHKKYISKELPVSQAFATTRRDTRVYRYHSKSSKCIYIFPLLGEPLSNIIRQRTGEEIKRWLSRCQSGSTSSGSMEEAMLQVIKQGIKIYEQFGIDDLLLECFRVHDSQLLYIYDSWMRSSVQIVTDSSLEIEGYFLGQSQLNQLRTDESRHSDAATGSREVSRLGDFFTKLSLLLLSLGLPEIKTRNYQFCQYEYNWKNIEEKLRYFKAKYERNRTLTQLAHTLVYHQNATMKDLWRLVNDTANRSLALYDNSATFSQTSHMSSQLNFTEGTNTPCQSRHNQSQSRNSQSKHIQSRHSQSNHTQHRYPKPRYLETCKKGNKQNCSAFAEKASVSRSQLQTAKHQNPSHEQQSMHQNYLKYFGKPNKLTLKNSLCDSKFQYSQNLGEELEKSTNTIYFQRDSQDGFCLKRLLAKSGQFVKRNRQPNSYPCLKVIDYLGLTEYVPKDLYQKSVLKALEGIYIKEQWQFKEYPNGSIFLGELSETSDKAKPVRSGKGIYLFDSLDLYFGDWINNVMQGTGIYVFKSGELYSGELVKGLKHGLGKFEYADGRVYQGYWDENQKTGLGTVFFPNNVKFFGIFKKGQKMTEGVFTRIRDDELLQYHGSLQNYNWQLNQFQLQGAYWEEGSVKNKLKACKINNFSVCDDELGNKFRGQCLDGIPYGFGIKETKDEIYEGSWVMGREDGQGKLIVKDQFQIQGQWREGVLIQYCLN